MIYLLFWMLAAYGMTSILVWGSIFENVREYIKLKSNFFGDLISCMLCTSTWVGFFMSLVLGGLCYRMFNVNHYIGFFFDGMFTAGSVWIINSIAEFYESVKKD